MNKLGENTVEIAATTTMESVLNNTEKIVYPTKDIAQIQTEIVLTSPKAPLPIMVKCSKSLTHILCLFNRIYSVSFLSKSLMRLILSSVGTSEEANFLSKIQRLKSKEIVSGTPN